MDHSEIAAHHKRMHGHHTRIAAEHKHMQEHHESEGDSEMEDADDNNPSGEETGETETMPRHGFSHIG